MHICCAPCSIYTLKKLRGEGADVYGYFFNPNIHPYTEFKKRLCYSSRLCAICTICRLLLIRLMTWIHSCRALWTMEKIAVFSVTGYGWKRHSRKGVEDKADAVTTTLLYSKHQRHEDIRKIGEELSVTHGIPFLYRDSGKDGAKESRNQRHSTCTDRPYCGCIFSEKERYWRAGNACDRQDAYYCRSCPYCYRPCFYLCR